jgi:hypothetical protein
MNKYQTNKNRANVKVMPKDDMKLYTLLTIGSIPVFLIAVMIVKMLPIF